MRSRSSYNLNHDLSSKNNQGIGSPIVGGEDNVNTINSPKVILTDFR